MGRNNTALSELGPARIEHVAAGAHLFRQGDPVTAIYQVESGCLRLERSTASGTTVVLHTARAGEMLAEAALFSTTYHCDAVALRDSRVRIFEKAAVLARLKPGSPAYALVAVLAQQLRRARQRIELRNIRSAKERMLLYFELQADRQGKFAVEGRLQDMAAELGLTRESLYRTLAALERGRRIKRSANSIHILKRG